MTKFVEITHDVQAKLVTSIINLDDVEGVTCVHNDKTDKYDCRCIVFKKSHEKENIMINKESYDKLKNALEAYTGVE